MDAVCDRIFTPETLRGLVVELRQQSSEFERFRQDRIDAIAVELGDVERRLRRLYESIEADAGLELGDVAPRLRELRARQDALKRAGAAVEAEMGPEVSLGEDEVWQAAEMMREGVRSCDDAAKLRQVMSAIVKRASIRGREVAVDYWPESIVNALGGSQCPVTWLLDLGSNQGPTD